MFVTDPELSVKMDRTRTEAGGRARKVVAIQDEGYGYKGGRCGERRLDK